MTREELLQDLNYARTLAEEGRHAPLIGGAYLVLFGVLLAVCYAAQFYILTSDTLPPAYAGFLWMGFGACAAIGVMALRGRTQRMPGVTSVGNKAERIVWNGVAIAIMPADLTSDADRAMVEEACVRIPGFRFWSITPVHPATRRF